jgi:hypothetical protein
MLQWQMAIAPAISFAHNVRLDAARKPAHPGAPPSDPWRQISMSNNACSRRFRPGIVALAVVAGALLPHASLARDGVSGCSVVEAKVDSKKVWRHTIELQVPQGSHCRVFIGDDRDRKAWHYCWLKRAEQNPVTETCDDPIENPDFDVWNAKAVCGEQTFRTYCRRGP